MENRGAGEPLVLDLVVFPGVMMFPFALAGIENKGAGELLVVLDLVAFPGARALDVAFAGYEDFDRETNDVACGVDGSAISEGC